MNLFFDVCVLSSTSTLPAAADARVRSCSQTDDDVFCLFCALMSRADGAAAKI